MSILATIPPLLRVLILAMLPIIELRGAIPYGLSIGLSDWQVLLVSIIGSSLPAPFLILFFRKLLDFMKAHRILPWLHRFLDHHIYRKSKKLKAANIVGIYLFVSIPLPSTGSYTGSALASILNIRIKYALPTILLGNATAAMVMYLISLAGIHLFF